MTNSTDLTHSARVRVNIPVSPADLAKFIESVPPEAELNVVIHEGGSQRDPYPIGYTFSAKWSS